MKRSIKHHHYLTFLVLVIIGTAWFVYILWLKPEPSAVDESPAVQDVPEGWISLFDGKTLEGWEIVRYGGEGEPYVHDGVLVLPMANGGFLTGLCWVGDSLPVNNYVILWGTSCNGL